MAQQNTYTCDACGYSLESWDEGNPYIRGPYIGGPRAKRYYFYHPGETQQICKILETILGYTPSDAEVEEYLENHAGNEHDFICYDCMAVFKIDPETDKKRCRKCRSTRVVDLCELAGKPCPKCGGALTVTECTAIS
jgi:DNA-directed RNA polymerase subunit RPC12/RpoP